MHKMRGELTVSAVTDEDLVAVTLSRAQWRKIRAAIPEVWSDDQLVLWDALAELDLDQPVSR